MKSYPTARQGKVRHDDLDQQTGFDVRDFSSFAKTTSKVMGMTRRSSKSPFGLSQVMILLLRAGLHIQLKSCGQRQSGLLADEDVIRDFKKRESPQRGTPFLKVDRRQFAMQVRHMLGTGEYVVEREPGWPECSSHPTMSNATGFGCLRVT